jgi:hypothetical protein
VRGGERNDATYVRLSQHEQASGLAEGKGVFLPDTAEEAVQAARSLLVDGALGEAGREVVVEERLLGEEVSLLAFADGQTVVGMPAAQVLLAGSLSETPLRGKLLINLVPSLSTCRTTSACWTATRDPTRAAWAPTLPPRSSRPSSMPSAWQCCR